MVAPGNDLTFLLGPILDSLIPSSLLSPTISVVPDGHCDLVLSCFVVFGMGPSIARVVVLHGVSIALSVESIGFTDISFVCIDSDNSFV